MKTVDIKPVIMSSVYRIMKFCIIDFLNISKFRHVRLSCEKCVCALSSLSHLLFVYISATSTGQIFMEFDVEDFYEKLSRKLKLR